MDLLHTIFVRKSTTGLVIPALAIASGSLGLVLAAKNSKKMMEANEEVAIDAPLGEKMKQGSSRIGFKVIAAFLIVYGVLSLAASGYTQRSASSSSTLVDSSADLADFQSRVSEAAASLRRSMESSAEMGNEKSSAELPDFQSRVSEAAASLRRSMESAAEIGSSYEMGNEKSAAELAAEASAQISNFISQYS